MKKIISFSALFLLSIILVGCSEGNGEKINVEFVELKYFDDKKEKPYLLYVSHDEKEYFYKELDKYEYDYQLEEFKNIKIIQKKQRAILFNVYYEYYYLSPGYHYSPTDSTEDKENKKKYFFYKYD